MENQGRAKVGALELAQRISTLQQEKEDAIFRGEFELAARLRDSEVECRSRLRNFSFPDYVLGNLHRLTESGSLPRFPVLDMLETKSGAADQRVLQLTAEAAQSPIRLVFEQIPESPSGMLRELLNVDDIFSMYFQAKLPVLSVETIARFKPQMLGEALRAMFTEIRKCTQRCTPVVLSLVAPTTFPDPAFQSTVLRGLKEIRCNLVVFEHAAAIPDFAEALLPEITLYLYDQGETVP